MFTGDGFLILIESRVFLFLLVVSKPEDIQLLCLLLDLFGFGIVMGNAKEPTASSWSKKLSKAIAGSSESEKFTLDSNSRYDAVVVLLMSGLAEPSSGMLCLTDGSKKQVGMWSLIRVSITPDFDPMMGDFTNI